MVSSVQTNTVRRMLADGLSLVNPDSELIPLLRALHDSELGSSPTAPAPSTTAGPSTHQSEAQTHDAELQDILMQSLLERNAFLEQEIARKNDEIARLERRDDEDNDDNDNDNDDDEGERQSTRRHLAEDIRSETLVMRRAQAQAVEPTTHASSQRAKDKAALKAVEERPEKDGQDTKAETSQPRADADSPAPAPAPAPAPHAERSEAQTGTASTDKPAVQKPLFLKLPMRPTPRRILAYKLLTRDFGMKASVKGPEAQEFRGTYLQEALTSHSLDLHLDQEQAKKFLRSADTTNLSILTCDLCRLPKLAFKDDGGGGAEKARRAARRISEFPPLAQPTPCCERNICTQCYLAGVKQSLQEDWWEWLDRQNWIACPMPSCGSAILAEVPPQDLLRDLGEGDANASMEIYYRAVAMRTVLHDLYLSEEALMIARRIHEHLLCAGKMYSPFDPRFSSSSSSSGSNDLGTFDPTSVTTIRVHGAGDVVIPLFTTLLRLQEPDSAKDCIVCGDKIRDVDIGSVEEWLGLCGSFLGDWTWRVLRFPLKLGIPSSRENTDDDGSNSNGTGSSGSEGNGDECCQHEITYCTGCLQAWLEAQRSANDRLICPTPGCKRALSYGEIQLYASDDTFQKYQKHKLLQLLAEDATFRPCLRPGCDNGDLHDVHGGDPRIQCSVCAFEMCYEHQEPWHAGQTCEQYDNYKRHGDPNFESTASWMQSNTKECPGCSRSIQKIDGCDHMTCKQCRSEFCWLCLADWKVVGPAHPCVSR